MWRKSSALLISIMILGPAILISCAGPAPIEEYNLARTAIDAAEEAGAATLAPGFYNRAEENFRNGTKAFRENDYRGAKILFDGARENAERAENAARLKKFQSGEGFP